MFDKKLKINNTLQYYYHLTYYDLGNSIDLIPQKGINICNGEPEGRRICVSDHPAKCFAAIPIEQKDYLSVYRTTNKVNAYHPYGVEDAYITGEMWLLEKTRFTRIMEIDPKVKNEDYHTLWRTYNKYSICAGSMIDFFQYEALNLIDALCKTRLFHGKVLEEL